MKDSAVIFALDGVLANDTHRQPDEGREVSWRQRYDQALIEEDPPIPEMVRLCQQLGEESDIVIVTERPITVSEVTIKWIRSHGLQYDGIYMKQDLSECPADVSKLELIQRAQNDRWNPWLVIDNDQKVIDKIAGVSGIQGLLVPI